MSVLVITGTGTGVGKTMVTAAIAALASGQGQRVAVVKPAQTGVSEGEPGDVDAVHNLAGGVTVRELRRYRDPLSPEAAARISGHEAVSLAEVAHAVSGLHAEHDVVLVEGAGGLLVRFSPDGGTLADIAWSVGAPVLIVAEAGLGTLNATTLTAEAATRRGLDVVGVVIGSWPEAPDLANVCNLEDLPVAAGAPLLGVLPEETSKLGSAAFRSESRNWLSPWFGGAFEQNSFAASVSAKML